MIKKTFLLFISLFFILDSHAVVEFKVSGLAELISYPLAMDCIKHYGIEQIKLNPNQQNLYTQEAVKAIEVLSDEELSYFQSYKIYNDYEDEAINAVVKWATCLICRTFHPKNYKEYAKIAKPIIRKEISRIKQHLMSKANNI